MIMTRERASNVATNGFFSRNFTVVVVTGGNISFRIVLAATVRLKRAVLV